MNVHMNFRLIPVLLLFILAGRSPIACADLLVAFELDESRPTGHGLYSHGAFDYNADFAPGGYSSQSVRHNIDPLGNPAVKLDGAFHGITGDLATQTGPTMTWCMWVKVDPNQWVSNHHTAILTFANGNFYDGAPGEAFLWLEDSTRKPHFNLGSIGNLVGPVGLLADQWVHLAATFDNGDMTFYVDGAVVDTLATADPNHSGVTTFPALAGREGWLGTAPNNGGLTEGMMGWTDDFGWFDRALDAAQIQQVIDDGVVATDASVNAPPPAKLGFIFGFELNESPDLSGDGHTLASHAASFTSGDFAPGGFSIQSSRHDLDPNNNPEADGAFWGITEDLASQTATGMTWCGWIKIDSSQWVNVHHTAIFTLADGNIYDNLLGEVFMWFEDSTRKPHFNLGGIGNLVGPTGLPMDQWVHLAATFDNGDMTLYVDGVPVHSLTSVVTTFPAMAGREGWLGTTPNGGGLTEGMMGWIDEFAWFNGAMNIDQIQDVRDNGLAGVQVFPGACGDPGTVYLPSDLNRDCYVDILDLRDFVDEWLVSVPILP